VLKYLHLWPMPTRIKFIVLLPLNLKFIKFFTIGVVQEYCNYKR